jgi:hypothetical protein
VANLDRYLGLVGVIRKSFFKGKEAINDVPVRAGRPGIDLSMLHHLPDFSPLEHGIRSQNPSGINPEISVNLLVKVFRKHRDPELAPANAALSKWGQAHALRISHARFQGFDPFAFGTPSRVPEF